MRILVEPSGYPELLNLGDLAMQRAALTRVAEMWPEADIQVFTDVPERFPRYAPNVRPLSTAGRQAWLSGYLPSARLVLPVPRAVAEWERNLRRRMPRALKPAARFKLALRGRGSKHLDDFFNAVSGADLLVVCGMGGVADVFDAYALDLLDTIALVKSNARSIVAMFGQGIGPLAEGSEVFRRAAEVLPAVDLIAVREGRISPGLLEKLGIPAERIMVTGDDATEIAQDSHPFEGRDCLGVSLRAADYSNVTTRQVDALRVILQRFGRSRSIPLVPLPTSRFLEEADRLVISSILDGYANVLGGAEEIADTDCLKRSLSRCRVIVAGSYHAAVFALSQGVPAVCLENHPYYHDKFHGLKSQFGEGVFVISMSQPLWEHQVAEALEEAWSRAQQLSPLLIAATARQVMLSRQAYRRVRDLVEDARRACLLEHSL